MSFTIHSCPLLRLQRQVAKLASRLVITITRQQILESSLQATVAGVLPHVTVERRHLGRYWSETVAVDSSKSRSFILRERSMSEKEAVLRQRSVFLWLLPWNKAFSLWRRKGKRFVNGHLHCIVSNLKRISWMSRMLQLEMARAANRPVFGPSATVLKQSASNFFSDDVIPGRYGPLQSVRQKFLFFAKFHNLTTNIFCCWSLHFTVLPTFRFTGFHANQWTMLGINQSNQHFHL